MSGPDRVAAALTEVAPPRAHEYVAEQIRRVIALRIVTPGGRLPYEQELAAALAVSRATVTQALRLLEREGLVEVRRGRGGGVFTRPVSTDGADPAVLRELAASRADIAAAAEARAVVEPAAAELAAGRVGARALARLRDLNEAMRGAQRDDHRFMRADSAFHLELAAAGGNRFLRDAVELSRLALARALEVLPDSPAWHDRSVAQHGDILAALAAGDGAAARRAMAEHVDDTHRALGLLLATLGS